MAYKQRQFKSYENDTRYWSGQTNKFTSSMKNTDIQYAIQTNDWSELEELPKKGLMRSAYNRENNIFNPASYDRYNNVIKKKIKLKKAA